MDDDFWSRPLPARRSFVPSVDIAEDNKHFLVTADVPGMKPEDIDIQVENNVLTIRGERKHEVKGEKHGYHRIERHYGSFQRAFTLPEGVDADKIEASVEHGTLVLRVPKPVSALPKKVKVNVGSLADKAKKLFGQKSDEAAPSAS
jgi:HSP20 family protein